MKGYLSTFQPAKATEQGTKVLMPWITLEPVPQPTTSVSPQAAEIHAWLLQRFAETGAPIKKIDAVTHFGTKSYNEFRDMYTFRLDGYPLEELVHHGLLINRGRG